MVSVVPAVEGAVDVTVFAPVAAAPGGVAEEVTGGWEISAGPESPPPTNLTTAYTRNASTTAVRIPRPIKTAG